MGESNQPGKHGFGSLHKVTWTCVSQRGHPTSTLTSLNYRPHPKDGESNVFSLFTAGGGGTHLHPLILPRPFQGVHHLHPVIVPLVLCPFQGLSTTWWVPPPPPDRLCLDRLRCWLCHLRFPTGGLSCSLLRLQYNLRSSWKII